MSGISNPNRVKLSGVKGYPPPPTTKLAICYRAGYQSQVLVNATGYGTEKKFLLHEKQTRHFLAKAGILEKLEVLEFQVYAAEHTLSSKTRELTPQVLAHRPQIRLVSSRARPTSASSPRPQKQAP